MFYFYWWDVLENRNKDECNNKVFKNKDSL